MNIIKFTTLDSTNQYLKKNNKKLPHLQIIWAKMQTKGQGRKDNTWYANKNSLTFSFILKENLQTKLINLLPIYIATILHKVIFGYNNQCLIKWPNDIYINDKKIAGILVEGIYQDKLQAMIIGIGINLNNKIFPNELKSKTTSLKLETKGTYQPEKMIEEIVNLFINDYSDFLNNPHKFINYYNNYHLLNDKYISYNDKGQTKFGKCLKIDKNGYLIVNSNNKNIHLISGEIEKISTK